MCISGCSAAKPSPALCHQACGSSPGSSVRGLPQARALEWVATSFSLRPAVFFAFWAGLCIVGCLAAFLAATSYTPVAAFFLSRTGEERSRCPLQQTCSTSRESYRVLCRSHTQSSAGSAAEDASAVLSVARPTGLCEQGPLSRSLTTPDGKA